MKRLTKTILVLVFVCLIISCGGESFSPGEIQYTWNPAFADLYINGELRHEGDILITHADGETVTVRAEMHPEDGWVFQGWSFIERYFIEGGEYASSAENPYSFNVGTLPQHLYINTLRFHADKFTVSETGDKVFFNLSFAGNKSAGIYSIKDKSLSFLEYEENIDYSVDPYGRVYNSNRDLNTIEIFDWETETFTELVHDIPFTELYSSIGEDNASFSWSPDLSKCVYIINNYETYEYILCVLDRASGIVTQKTLPDNAVCALTWSLDSANFYILEKPDIYNHYDLHNLYRYDATSLESIRLADFNGQMNNFCGPDRFGNFYFYTLTDDNNSVYDQLHIVKLRAHTGTREMLFSFEEFEKVPDGEDGEYYIYPSVRQYKDIIIFTTDKRIYQAGLLKPEALISFRDTLILKGDTVMYIPGPDVFIVRTKRNYAYDLYMINAAGEEDRITKPELILQE